MFWLIVWQISWDIPTAIHFSSWGQFCISSLSRKKMVSMNSCWSSLPECSWKDWLFIVLIHGGCWWHLLNWSNLQNLLFGAMHLQNATQPLRNYSRVCLEAACSHPDNVKENSNCRKFLSSPSPPAELGALGIEDFREPPNASSFFASTGIDVCTQLWILKYEVVVANANTTRSFNL